MNDYRSATFDDRRPGFELLNVTDVSRKTVPRWLCSMHCLKDPNCLSYNYCGPICTLNDKDAYSEFSQLVVQENCDYSGMLADTQPHCSQWAMLPAEFYLNINVQQGVCNIKEKMVVDETVCGTLSDTRRDVFLYSSLFIHTRFFPLSLIEICNLDLIKATNSEGTFSAATNLTKKVKMALLLAFIWLMYRGTLAK